PFKLKLDDLHDRHHAEICMMHFMQIVARHSTRGSRQFPLKFQTNVQSARRAKARPDGAKKSRKRPFGRN
ncbi:MAG: hypothetical protein ACRCTX_12315, partial [Afipia sp.]